MRSTRILNLVGGVLRFLIVLNFICLALFLAAGVGSFPFEVRLVDALAKDGIADPLRQIQGARLAMGVGGIAVIPAHVILTRLASVVSSVALGTAFATVNAMRLKTIAWALLAIQFLDLGFGWIASRLEEAPGWSPSVTGWLAVLLLFVLAEVFEQGAAMREELDATV